MKTLTELIFQSTSPWDNPYQGQDKRVVFVCSAGILRSATAARLYAHKYNTRAAGSEEYALIPLTNDLVLWANELVFVNKENYNTASKHWKFNDTSFADKLIRVLNIPDKYPHMHPELQQAFKDQYEDF